ncbi:bifunctional glycosyltransferase/CDP-glycerol:glycerophosphate glycerophosphotransferase [Bacillus sp. B-jedd]|uniref:bifunctional glycosyltransferase/CDP-glycerol:glycerophosphate glycerophosphotransferase n=1 Tax=Bacillus sp. B-jedd TaxID=1476857 RepID=UPI0005155E67|nr:bifunctional glycosyltransferase family 2 protein/CDP-glycerol:glycerophosphate glycerophosphotransferase [Bacillus sp. B-jedd]CEG29090.1 teichoic acid biosynthesis protein F [Bacillus sp. B-jedd]
MTDNKSPILSVVVIAYNNELYIEEALESLEEQTLSNMEVVVVNDASTDRTGEIIDRFIEGKQQFKAIHLSKNSGGCSTPRNTGIANSTGKYLMFLDGDDWYTVNACEKMVAAAERTNSDFVAGQVIRTNNYEIWYHKQIYSQERTHINVREFNVLLFDSLSVNKIYKRSFLDQHGLRFPEGIHYEDIVFTGKAYFLAKSVSIIPEPVYYWRVVEDAAVKSITNRRFDFDNFKNRITAHRMFDKFLKENGFGLYQGVKNNKFLRHDLKLYTNDYLLYDEEYKEKFHQLIHEYMHEVMDEYSFIQLQEKDRILYFLLYINDREAFEDYKKYINGLQVENDRIYTFGGRYYFKPSFPDRLQEKFLEIENPELQFEIRDLQLSKVAFSFEAEVKMPALIGEEPPSSWLLRNRHTHHEIASIPVGNRVSLDLRDVEPGNYYLFLQVHHEGNLIERVVKKPAIPEFVTIKTEDTRFSRVLFVNHKNSFAIKVLPLKKFDQIKWIFQKRKAVIPISKLGKIKGRITNSIKQRFRKLSLKENWVVFESHMGKQYSDSPKYLYEELLRTGRKYTYIWSLEEPDAVDIPGPAIKVQRNSLKHFYYLARAKYWIDNQGIAHLLKKKKGQVYVQTWHGTPLKRMGYDQKALPSPTELSRLSRQTNAWNYFVSPNPYSTAIFRRAFRYGGEILETGYPRNDILISKPEQTIEKVKRQLGIDQGKRILLFAPTFRDWDSNSFQKTLKNIQELSNTVGENTVILLRLHYLLSSMVSQHELPDNILNASTYQDIQELFLISDMLITDYSSVMFDYALLKRPIILYCYDLDEYVSRRGTYFNLAEKAPGPLCTSIDEVIAFINEPEKLTAYHEALERFASEFGSLEDGHASSKVIKKVFG